MDFFESLEKAYNNFLLRDLPNMFSGYVIIFTTYFLFLNDFEKSLKLIPNSMVHLLLMIAFSYFIGLIMSEGFVIFGIFATKPYNMLHRAEYHQLLDRIFVQYKNSLIPTKQIERIIYYKHVAASIGTAAFISTINLILSSFIHEYNWIKMYLIIISVMIFLICVFENRLMQITQTYILDVHNKKYYKKNLYKGLRKQSVGILQKIIEKLLDRVLK